MNEQTTSTYVDALHDTIEGLTRQFGYRVVSQGVPALTAGGLSALEDAFAVLDWSDPHPCPEGACEYPGCTEWATCGTPTSDGYKQLCSVHYREQQS